MLDELGLKGIGERIKSISHNLLFLGLFSFAYLVSNCVFELLKWKAR